MPSKKGGIVFVINEEIVGDIKSLAAQAPGPYSRVVAWLDQNYKEMSTALIHMDAMEEDVNFNNRLHYRRGFIASVDALRNFLADPGGVLPEGKMEEVIPKDNSF
jgi:hypothetical protein